MWTLRQIRDAQCEHWQRTFALQEEMFGVEPSYAARIAAEIFNKEGKKEILELGSGQGRDSLFLAGCGFHLTTLDYSAQGLQAIRAKAERLGRSHAITTIEHDVRKPLPFKDDAFEACFSHMLFCMALTTAELKRLTKEICRVLKPGGLNIYTVRNVNDAGYGTGVRRGDDMYEIEGGFVVHFFSLETVQRLAKGYKLIELEEFQEGNLPRKLSMVTLRKNFVSGSRVR